MVVRDGFHQVQSRLSADHPNLKFSYKVRLPQALASRSPQFVQDWQALVAQCPKRDWNGREAVMAIDALAEHLYQPLILDAENPLDGVVANVDEKQASTITPTPLNASEQDFVTMLHDDWRDHAATFHADESLYLLRNLSRGKGIGFFESEGFYPDFILWHRTAAGVQRLVFVEPHGMRQDDAPEINNKVHLAKNMKKYLASVLPAPGCPVHEFDAYIVSAAPFQELRRKHGVNWTERDYAKHPILFPAAMRSSPRLAGLL